MSHTKHRVAGAIVAVVVSAAVLTAAALLYIHRVYVSDQISVWSYSPTQEIIALEDRIGFSDKGEFYFRTTHPSLDEAAQFNSVCPRQEAASPILGCYTAGRIYIYNIENQRLDGIEEVTAAHEMLHAAWERMSSDEQKHLETLLRAEYESKIGTSLEARMGYYERNEPAEFVNELHSIIPTEVRDISPGLETYYKQYFQDRVAVVDLFEQYNEVFLELSERADDLYSQLSSLGPNISQRTAKYDSDAETLTADIADFNSRANGGQFTSISQFNAQRAALTARSSQLEADRSAINDDINRYNQMYEEYQVIAGEIEALNQSIDSFGELEEAPGLQ